jgi:hypothetical protein
MASALLRSWPTRLPRSRRRSLPRPTSRPPHLHPHPQPGRVREEGKGGVMEADGGARTSAMAGAGTRATRASAARSASTDRASTSPRGAARMPTRGAFTPDKLVRRRRPRAVQLGRATATARATDARAAREGHREGRRRRPLSGPGFGIVSHNNQPATSFGSSPRRRRSRSRTRRSRTTRSRTRRLRSRSKSTREARTRGARIYLVTCIIQLQIKHIMCTSPRLLPPEYALLSSPRRCKILLLLPLLDVHWSLTLRLLLPMSLFLIVVC